jgi:arginine repressor
MHKAVLSRAQQLGPQPLAIADLMIHFDVVAFGEAQLIAVLLLVVRFRRNTIAFDSTVLFVATTKKTANKILKSSFFIFNL